MTHDVVVIGASSGGLEALIALVRELPGELRAAVFVVVHTSPDNPGILPHILARAGRLPAVHARDGVRPEAGRLYVAPPDHHLLLDPGRIRVVRGARENGFRPAVDPLFRTAARSYGARVIGVVLSGGLDDGSLGLDCIKRAGGIAVVQDPREAVVDSMPRSALRSVRVDHVLDAAAIGRTIAELTATPSSSGAESMTTNATEPDPVLLAPDALRTGALPGPPSPFTCRECGGTLWETGETPVLSFRCHVGHGYTAESLLVAQGGAVEEALWTALRALEEHAALQRQMAERSRDARLQGLATSYERRSADAVERAALIRRVLARAEEPVDAPVEDGV